MSKVQPKTKASEPGPLKQWAMIAFESMGAGALAIMLVFAAVLVVVGVYVQVVWPLTDWDMVGVSLEPYESAIIMALVFVFITGSAVGFWFVSGAAWQTQRQPPSSRRVPPKRTIARARY
jgi:hypothetical protein